MKKSRHKASNAGVDPRAIEQAATLLVRAIVSALQQPSEQGQGAPRNVEKRPVPAIAPPMPPLAPTAAPAPVTREEAVKIAARLYTLGRASSGIGLPLEIAAAWLPLSDLAAFADRAEGHVRALVALFDEFIAAHPNALKERGTASTEFTVAVELDIAKEQLARLDRIENGSITVNRIDMGPGYLPPECRPAGYRENWPPPDPPDSDDPLNDL